MGNPRFEPGLQWGPGTKRCNPADTGPWLTGQADDKINGHITC